QRRIGDPLQPQLGGDVAAGEVVPIPLTGDVLDDLGLHIIAAGLRDDVDVRTAAAADFGAHGRGVNRDLFGRTEVHVVHRAVIGRRVGSDAVVVQVVAARPI